MALHWIPVIYCASEKRAKERCILILGSKHPFYEQWIGNAYFTPEDVNGSLIIVEGPIVDRPDLKPEFEAFLATLQEGPTEEDLAAFGGN